MGARSWSEARSRTCYSPSSLTHLLDLFLAIFCHILEGHILYNSAASTQRIQCIPTLNDGTQRTKDQRQVKNANLVVRNIPWRCNPSFSQGGTLVIDRIETVQEIEEWDFFLKCIRYMKMKLTTVNEINILHNNLKPYQ